MTAADLRHALDALGLSQVEVAQQAGVSPKSVNYWCRGARPIPAHFAAYIAKAIRVRQLEESLAATWTLLDAERRAS